MPQEQIPNPVIAEVSDALAWFHTHSELNVVFQRSNAPGDPPLGNKIDKCGEWLRRANNDEGINAFAVLGGALEEFMEKEPNPYTAAMLEEKRNRVKRALERQGLSYQQGGRMLGATTATPTRSLQTIIRERDLGGLDTEFQRALDSVASDPPAAVTAACAIIESLCKVYIADNGLTMPSDQSIKPLFREVQRHLGLQAGSVEDQDINRMLGGLASTVDGIGSLRTHAGSAHGRGRHGFSLEARHARLAIHSAHTIVHFILETWDVNKSTSARAS